jgi:integrase
MDGGYDVFVAARSSVALQYALKALAGMRHGEVAALTWRAIDYTTEPLARIHVVRAYNSATGQIKTTKTEDGRAVPMHPRWRRPSPRGGCRTGRGCPVASRPPMTSWCRPAT